MATFDKLSAEQRAIIELVLERGRSYEELSGMLRMPEARVRELARDALEALSPVTARRVEEDWRGQLADYLLGQQSGPESTATRGHLRRSEAARAWAASLLDSLDSLYRDGLPSIPDGDRAAGRGPRVGARAPRAPAPAAPKGEERPTELSPEARAAIKRRRALGAAAAVSLVVALGVLVWPIGVLSRGDGKGGGASARSAASATGRLQLVDRAVLRPLPGNQGAGLAVVAKRGGKPQLVVQARLKPNARGQAYEVWLYNSRTDAKSLGAQVTDRQGNYQGAGPLPGDYRRYRFIDVSLEPIDQNQAHSGHSVLRGRVVHTG